MTITEHADQELGAGGSESLQKTAQQWRQQLTEQQYAVCRCAATEPAFSGQYWNHKEAGTYSCVCCGAPLFASSSKYDSGSGSPSFFQPIQPERLLEKTDNSHGMLRTEVLCGHCQAHLGHVFSDGPPPTGLRYCINSAALRFAAE